VLVEERDAYGAKILRADARITREGVDSDARHRFAAMGAQVFCCSHWHQKLFSLASVFSLASEGVFISIRESSH